MSKTVMAAFSSTDLNEALFRRALHLAEKNDALLVLVDVRHLRQADRLERALASGTYLGHGAIKKLARSVKRERNQAVRRALATMENEACRRGLQVETHELKGPYADSVVTMAREVDADIVVVEERPESERLEGRFQVVRV